MSVALYYFRVSRVSPTGIFQYPDTSDHYERPPYTVKFSAPSQSMFIVSYTFLK